MGRLSERLSQYPIVGLDSAVFIYHFEEHPTYHPLTTELFSGIEVGERDGVTSTITLMEIIVHPLSHGRRNVARQYEVLLVNFPNLELVDLDRDVVRQAAQLRAAYRIRSPDALQVSASLTHNADVLVTTDRKLERLKDELDVIILEDLILGG